MEKHLLSMSSLEHRSSPEPASTDSPTQTSAPTPYLPGQWQVAGEPVPIPNVLNDVPNEDTVPEGDPGNKPYMGPPSLSSFEPEIDSKPESAHLLPVRLHLVHILCFLLTFIIYVAFIPQFIRYSSPPTGDQPFYLMDVISMVQDGDLNVKNNYDNSDFDKFYALAPHPPDFVGMGAPYPLPRQLANTPARPLDEEYSAHPPGLAILIMPSWIIGSWFMLWWPATIVTMCLLGALLAVNVFLLAQEVSRSMWVGLAAWLPIAFSNPVMSYSYLLFTELTTGLLLIYVLRRLAMGWGANGTGRILLIGICIGFLPWLAWRCILIVGGLGLFALVQWVRELRRNRQDAKSTPRFNPSTNYELDKETPLLKNERDESPQVTRKGSRPARQVLSIIWLLIPIIISGVVLVSYSLFKSGEYLPSSTSSERGRTDIFYWPWAGNDELLQYISNSFGLFFDETFGLLIYAPIYILAIVGVLAILRFGPKSHRWLLLWMAVCSLPYLGPVVAYEGWHGVWSPPARYMTTFVPLMAAPLAFSLVTISRGWAGWLYKSIYAGLALIGMGLMYAIINNPLLMWPSDSDVVFDWLASEASPLSQFDLRPFLPSYRFPDAVTHPANTGWLLATSIFIVLLGYFLMNASRRRSSGQLPRHLPYAAHNLLWLGALGTIGAGWLATNLEYLEHKTVLTEKSRWQLPTSPTFRNPSGITFMNGMVYITAFGPRREPAGDYGQGEMGTLALDTGVYTIVQPVSSGAVLPWANPGDVKAGPAGLLYVLNNGADEQAMYVMKPDGEVVNQLPLVGKSSIAKGLFLDPRGYIFIADMVGGRVIQYEMSGGNALNSYTGMNSQLNNPTGVFVDQDGSIYTTETFAWVQHLNPDGSPLRKYDTGCLPIYIVPNGDWLDVSCHDGMVSINKKTGKVQKSQVVEGSTRLQSPTGLTYGPDGTLYVLDGNTLIAYSVQH